MKFKIRILKLFLILFILAACAPMHRKAFAPSTIPTSNYIFLKTDLKTALIISKKALIK